MDASDRARRRVRNFAFVLAGLFAVVAAVSWWTGRDNPREGSRALTGGGPVEIRSAAKAYRAVYRVENRAGKTLTVTTEKLWVRRPFDSRVESWRGAPPGKERLTVRQSNFGILAQVSVRSAPLNVAAPPSIASGDVRMDAVLAEAVRSRTVLRRERREVFGRTCQVYRAGGPVSAGDLRRYEPGRGEYADVCVDANGLVLEEYWVSNGRLIQRRAAVELEVDPPIDPGLFEIDVPEREGFNRGAIRRISGNRADGWVLRDRPDGFEDIGRYVVAISPNALPQTGQFASEAPVSTTDVYVKGPDLLVVDQDPSLADVTRREGRQVRTIDVAGFSEAVVIYDARMSEVRGTDKEGSVVRVFGTLPPSQLVELARSMVKR